MRTLKDAELIWVDTNAAKAAFNAVDQLDPTISLHDLPALTTDFKTALVVFATPFTGLDWITGQPSLLVDAVLWGPGRIHDADNGADATTYGMSVLALRHLNPDRSQLTNAEQQRLGDAPTTSTAGSRSAHHQIGFPTNTSTNQQLAPSQKNKTRHIQKTAGSSQRCSASSTLPHLQSDNNYVASPADPKTARQAAKTGQPFNPDRHTTNVVTSELHQHKHLDIHPLKPSS